MSDDAAVDQELSPPTAEPITEPDAADVHSIRGGRLWLLAALTACLVVLADWLFWDCPRGWTLGAYGLLLAVAMLVWDRPCRRSRAIPLLILAIAALCLQCLEEPSALTIACIVLGLAMLAILLREGWSASAVTWARRCGLMATAGWLMVFKDADDAARRGPTGAAVGRSGVRALRNWCIPLALGFVFVLLFAAANPVISKWLRDAIDGLRDLLKDWEDLLPSGWRVLMWAVLAVCVWALLRFRSKTSDSSREASAVDDQPEQSFPSPPLVIRSLALFNLLFVVQTVLDVYYLWGGGELPDGMTYAEYAHRGAYPLVAAAILAALFVLAAFRTEPRGQSLRVARGLVYVWLVQNLFLVVSAGWRLDLYVDAYALTRLRVAAAIWMLLVFCGIVWILVRIAAGRSNLWLINVNTITALLVIYAGSFVDFDGLIARYNVAHCWEARGKGPKIDIPYLERLGPETLPALIQLANQSPQPPNATAVHGAIRRLRENLQEDLSDWRGWTWRRHRLLQLAPPAEPPTPSTQHAPPDMSYR